MQANRMQNLAAIRPTRVCHSRTLSAMPCKAVPKYFVQKEPKMVPKMRCKVSSVICKSGEYNHIYALLEGLHAWHSAFAYTP